METTYAWSDVPGGTRMTLTNRGEPRGLAGFAGPLVQQAMRRATTKDLARLKRILEQPPEA
jgi:hypothetical protein